MPSIWKQCKTRLKKKKKKKTYKQLICKQSILILEFFFSKVSIFYSDYSFIKILENDKSFAYHIILAEFSNFTSIFLNQDSTFKNLQY